MKQIALIVAILTTAVCGASVIGQDTRPRPPAPRGPGGLMMTCPAMAVMPPHAGMVDDLARTLQLSKDQTAKLRKVVTDGEKALLPLRKTSANASEALRASVLASLYDSKTVAGLSAKAQKSEAAVISASIGEWTWIRAILTAKQFAALRQAMAAPGPRPGGPGGPPPGSVLKGARQW